MAFQLKPRPTKPTAPLYTWKVLKERPRGGLIHGRRRAVGETFQAPLAAMAQDEREGVVERVPGPTIATGTTGAAPAAQSRARPPPRPRRQPSRRGDACRAWGSTATRESC